MNENLGHKTEKTPATEEDDFSQFYPESSEPRTEELSQAEEERQAQALLAGLSHYDLEPSDLALLEESNFDASGDHREAWWPVVAVVGRPNVGKSTLVNRILGKRVAVVLDEPGVTRDRVSYQSNWAGRDFHLVDTGGWDVGLAGLDREVARQAEIAVELSDVAILVVDATVGPTAVDEHVVSMLRAAGKPVVLAANKVDSDLLESDAAALWSLGLGQPHSISALHGRGTGDLLDAVIAVLPEFSSRASVVAPGAPRISLVGRPNVGKSSLLNKLAGEYRVVVDDVAGTTRDPVDEVIEIDDQKWVFVDTAGIRRRIKRTVGADYYAALRTEQAIDNSDLSLVLIDGQENLSEQDVRVINQVVKAGRALVIVNNKWDLVDEDRQAELSWEHERDLGHVSWAPVINISAKTGWHTNRITRAMNRALDGWSTRIPTARFNAFLGELVAANPHPLRGGKQPRILFGTQVGACPPRFVLFTTGFLEPTYRRFIERKLRETFDFEGTPIQISVRVREKRRRS